MFNNCFLKNSFVAGGEEGSVLPRTIDDAVQIAKAVAVAYWGAIEEWGFNVCLHLN